jgi:hypothetical protein
MQTSENGFLNMPFALAFGDGLICGPDLMRAIDTARIPNPDRRRRFRVGLSWTVYFWRSNDARPIEGQTRNISSEGLYCVVNQEFIAGEAVTYTLMVPAFHAERRYDIVRLAGRAEVLRFDPLGAGVFGLACRVQDYKVLPPGTE